MHVLEKQVSIYLVGEYGIVIISARTVVTYIIEQHDNRGTRLWGSFNPRTGHIAIYRSICVLEHSI